MNYNPKHIKHLGHCLIACEHFLQVISAPGAGKPRFTHGETEDPENQVTGLRQPLYSQGTFVNGWRHLWLSYFRGAVGVL